MSWERGSFSNFPHTVWASSSCFLKNTQVQAYSSTFFDACVHSGRIVSLDLIHSFIYSNKQLNGHLPKSSHHCGHWDMTKNKSPCSYGALPPKWAMQWERWDKLRTGSVGAENMIKLWRIKNLYLVPSLEWCGLSQLDTPHFIRHTKGNNIFLTGFIGRVKR